MIKLILVHLCLLACYCSIAQQPGTVRGKITDKNHLPVEFANVYLTTADDSSKVISGAITDSAGGFLLRNMAFGKYILHVQCLGYQKYTANIAITSASSHAVTDNIILVPASENLNDVAVKSLRNMIRRTEEGMVISASENITQIGGTATDLFKNMPGVIVDAEGGVTLRGKSPLILINGKISGLAGTDRSVNLDQIPASSIDRIEIITNPSSKYDADAEGGIINIILKKNTNKGLNGSFVAGAGFGDRYRLNGAFLLNYKQGKWNFGAAYDNWYTTRTRSVNGDRIQLDIPAAYYLTQRRADERTVQNQNARISADFSPNQYSTLTAELSGLFQGENNGEMLYTTAETASHSFTSKNSRYSNEIRRLHSGEISLAYNRKFRREDQSFSLRFNTALNKDIENTDITTQSLSSQDMAQGQPFLQQTHTYNKSSLGTLSADYVQPISQKAFLEAGYKLVYRNLNNDFLRSAKLNGADVIDAANTDIFHFRENIHALYTQYNSWTGDKKQPSWKYSIGIRAELVNNNGYTILNPVQFNNQYLKFFPSANLIYYTGNRDMVRLSYSKRINRPGFGQLTPFIDITDSLNQRIGNPNLQPEISHVFDLSYQFSFPQGSLLTSLFYRRTNDVILGYTSLQSNGIALTRLLNFGNSTTYGVEANLMYRPNNWWDMNLNVSGYNLEIASRELVQSVQRNQFTFFSKLVNNFTPWKNGRLQLVGNYTSPIAITQGKRISVYFADLGIQQKIMKGQGRIGFSLTDIFNTQQSGQRISDVNYSFYRVVKVDTRAIMFTFGYTFRSAFKENLMENKFKNE